MNVANGTAWHMQDYLQSPEYLKINPCGTCVQQTAPQHEHSVTTTLHATAAHP